jgi:hypothetical protein
MPTIHRGHVSDLKYDDGFIRVWVSRMTIDDGELDPVQVEALRDGRWVDVTTGRGAVVVCVGQGARCGIRSADGFWHRRK